MNLFRIIFSVYLIALTLVPCTDTLGVHKENVHAETTHSDANHANEHEDTCPPLCSCNCCGVSGVFFFQESISFEVVSYNEKIKIPLNQSAVSFFAHTIWQPPKI
jgi:hypothetical protein